MAAWIPKAPSIEGRLAVFAAAVFLPGMAALAVLVGLNILEARRAQENALLAAARAASAAIDLRLATLGATAEALAESDAVAAGDWERLSRRVDRAQLGEGVVATVSDAGGARTLGQARPEGSTSPISGSEAVDAPARPLSPGGSVTVSGLTGDEERRAVIVRAAAPDRPEPLSVALWLDPQILLSDLGRWALPSQAMVTLVDTEHRVIARSRNPERFVGRPATPRMIAAMQAEPEGVTTSRSLEGRPTVVAYHRSGLSGWTTMVVVPRSHVLRPVWLNTLALAVLMVMLGATSVLLARRQIRALSDDIRALEQDAQSIAAGRLVARKSARVINLDRIQAALSEASAELLRREERQTLLINELNHRVKNTLATIQSLAAQTFRGADGDLRTSFEQRLGALAGAHDLLTQTTWSAVDMVDVVNRCGGACGVARIRSAGPSVPLQPEAALALCMCLHELTTNSLKYGALSRPSGVVDLTWTVEDDEMVMTWREEGGPPVRPPERTGFGSRLVERLARHELNGRIERDFRPEGLVVVGRFRPNAKGRWTTDL